MTPINLDGFVNVSHGLSSRLAKSAGSAVSTGDGLACVVVVGRLDATSSGWEEVPTVFGLDGLVVGLTPSAEVCGLLAGECKPTMLASNAADGEGLSR
ncbi:hypothetical protein T265_05222 [Opisthorchis viverrini]|uniref:Uncharacterized protein n=1 Tax=Opisthorchis viverrini TaxID=6198 RepID=A0A074ZWS7_OPIVI|nr:hypothetical protein T265_05222 [Opisthorchis viverrini]KER27795.1 hypothetical protein T265_05222 [Opisthorchis viverrini]